jgi:hypothetical protein
MLDVSQQLDLLLYVLVQRWTLDDLLLIYTFDRI